MRIKRNISTIPGSTKKSGRLLSPRVSLVETVLLWRSKNAATGRRPHFLVLVAQSLAHPVQRPHASLVTPPNKLTPASPFHNMFHGLTGVEPGASHKDWECSCGFTGVPALELPTHKERIKKNGYHQQRPHGHTPNRRGRSSRSIPQLPSRLYHERIGREHTTLRYPSIKQSPHRA